MQNARFNEVFSLAADVNKEKFYVVDGTRRIRMIEPGELLTYISINIFSCNI